MLKTARETQAVLVALSRLLCYLARAQLGVLLPLLSAELGLSTADQGFLMSRYASGYIVTQVVGGMCADRMGGYPVLAFVLFASGLCCLAAPMLAGLGTTAFGFAFTLLGLVQGAAYPAGSVVCAQWLLPAERSWASSISAIGAATGAFLVSSAAPLVAARFGWQAVFLCTAMLCFALLAAWLRLGSSSPAQCHYVSQEELAVLREAGVLPSATAAATAVQSSRKPRSLRDAFPPPSFFLHGSVGVLFLSHFAQNWQQYFSEWLPLFYTSHLGVSREVAGLHLGAVALVELPARAATAGLPDLLLRRGSSLLWSRKQMSLQGFAYHLVLSFLVVALLLRSVTAPLAFTAVLGLAKASQAFHAGGYFANYLDLTRDYSGILAGVGNTVATLAGVSFPNLASATLESSDHGWVILAASMMIMDIVAMLAISLGMSTDCLDEAARASKAAAAKAAGGGGGGGAEGACPPSPSAAAASAAARAGHFFLDTCARPGGRGPSPRGAGAGAKDE